MDPITYTSEGCGEERVIQGARMPAAEVAALVCDGIEPERITDFYPGVSAEAAGEAPEFSDYADSAPL
ncbi:DUF433 domain-containing protein [Streptomyces venezuelae]|uniref:DUF433 domain-containing protein n=1 Tax=Streptomyces sp. B6(2022) TaxID=3404749 RepID=UPI00311F3C06